MPSEASAGEVEVDSINESLHNSFGLLTVTFNIDNEVDDDESHCEETSKDSSENSKITARLNKLTVLIIIGWPCGRNGNCYHDG